MRHTWQPAQKCRPWAQDVGRVHVNSPLLSWQGRVASSLEKSSWAPQAVHWKAGGCSGWGGGLLPGEGASAEPAAALVLKEAAERVRRTAARGVGPDMGLVLRGSNARKRAALRMCCDAQATRRRGGEGEGVYF